MSFFIIITIVKAVLITLVLVTLCAYMTWIERKVLAHIQIRPGPYRVGPNGLLQPLADIIKLVTKEGILPATANKFLFVLAPFFAVAIAFISISVIPFGPEIEILGNKTQMGLADINMGVLMILALSSLGVYGLALGGWASNSKYALLGGLRSSAQMVSYELPMAMAIASPLLIMNTVSFREMVGAQSGYWLGVLPQWTIFLQPVAFLLFLVAGFAETNRVPFDLPEAESELVAGFHTEYSSTNFAAFFTAEYANMVTICSVATLLFLGGWSPLWPTAYGSDIVPSLVFALAAAALFFHATQPLRFWDKYSYPAFGLIFLLIAGVFQIPLLKPFLMPLFWFGAKVGILLFLFIWIRGTLPRFRYDQLMSFAWTFMFPVAVVNLLVTALVVALI